MSEASEADSPPRIPVIFPRDLSAGDINNANMRSVYYQRVPVLVVSQEFTYDAFWFGFAAGRTQATRAYKIDDIVSFAALVHYALQRPLVLNQSNLPQFYERCRQFFEEMINSAIRFDAVCIGFFLRSG